MVNTCCFVKGASRSLCYDEEDEDEKTLENSEASDLLENSEAGDLLENSEAGDLLELGGATLQTVSQNRTCNTFILFILNLKEGPIMFLTLYIYV